jgi:hypothetical protein
MDQNRTRASPPDGTGLFDKMLDELCPYHQGPVKHTLQECVMMKCFFTSIPAKGDAGKKPKDDKGDGKGGGFPVINNYFLIFGGPVAYDIKRCRKLERREVYAAEPATPAYLNWSDAAITFDRDDHLAWVPHLGQYPLVVDPIITNTRLSKVLMDGGSGLNILYADTLDLIGIGRS